MRNFRRAITVLVALIVAAGLGFFVFSYKPAIAPLPEGQAPTFDAALVNRGAQLAAIGDCTSCHTAPGGETFAGGLSVPTPFGTLFSTNITPDPETGIGRWSEEAFQRAMHDGVDREGNHLYPAFPFDHFTHVEPDDLKALYAYMMSREPVAATPPANQLPFPFNFRPILAGWKLLFLDNGPLPPVEGQSEEWLRGRYLAEGLAHCSACHTPRNAMGAEDKGRHYDGAHNIEGWYAYPIGDTSPSPTRWSVDSMTQYLSQGYAQQHGTARGPMAQVTANLRIVDDADIRAMAGYIVSQMGGEPEATQAATETQPQVQVALQSGDSLAVPQPITDSGHAGAAIYAAACSTCHAAGRPQPYGGLDLKLSTALHADSPQNIVNMVLYGLPAAAGQPTPIMPGFEGTLGAEQMVALLGYLRSEFTDEPAWSNAQEVVADTMGGETEAIIYSTDGQRRTPMASTTGEVQ